MAAHESRKEDALWHERALRAAARDGSDEDGRMIASLASMRGDRRMSRAGLRMLERRYGMARVGGGDDGEVILACDLEAFEAAQEAAGTSAALTIVRAWEDGERWARTGYESDDGCGVVTDMRDGMHHKASPYDGWVPEAPTGMTDVAWEAFMGVASRRGGADVGACAP